MCSSITAWKESFRYKCPKCNIFFLVYFFVYASLGMFFPPFGFKLIFFWQEMSICWHNPKWFCCPLSANVNWKAYSCSVMVSVQFSKQGDRKKNRLKFLDYFSKSLVEFEFFICFVFQFCFIVWWYVIGFCIQPLCFDQDIFITLVLTHSHLCLRDNINHDESQDNSNSN